MKSMRNWMTGAGMRLALAGGMVATTAQVDRGGGMLYDDVLAVPEPASALLLALGLASLGASALRPVARSG